MIKMLNACTSELDDAKIAVKEILEQLNLEKNQLKNSAAVITVYQDTDDEVIKAVADSLPFESIGLTTFMSAANGQSDYTQITVSVLTSNDVEFTVACSDKIVPGSEKEVYTALSNAIAKTKNPRAILGCSPLLPYANVDHYTKIINRINPKILFFSGVAIDSTTDYHLQRTIYNGEKYEDRFPFIVLGAEDGVLNLDFAIATISMERAFSEREDATVTKSAPGLLIEIDGKPIAEYLGELGITKNKDGKFTFVSMYPFIVDFNDGTQPIIREMFSFTPEGAVVIGGDIPVGSKIFIGKFDVLDIVNKTEKVLSEFVKKNKNANGFILNSCCSRYFNLGFNYDLKEVEAVQKIISATGKPFVFSYVCGEMCPVYNNENEAVNRGHNYTCIMAAI